jgi:hypothetical protein
MVRGVFSNFDARIKPQGEREKRGLCCTHSQAEHFMFEPTLRNSETAFVSVVVSLLMLVGNVCAADTPEKQQAQPRFSLGQIPPLTVKSELHFTASKNGVKFDVFYDKGPKQNVAIYTINTGRKQLVLTPEKHQAILEDLVRRKFTVIVADFKEKQLLELELEHYVVQLTEDARAVVDGTLTPVAVRRAPAASRKPKVVSRTETEANDYFTLMPGFTVERDVAWFRYGDIPQPFREAIARQLNQPFHESDGDKTNTYDIIYPVYGPNVGVLTNYGSDEKGREDYYPVENKFLVQAFAFKNLAIVHQQYFNDPVGGYPKGYGYYGDQFAVCFIRHVKGNAVRYHLDTQKICCFGHSKGSEVPGMLVNKLRASPEFRYGKVDFKKLDLSDADKTLRSPYDNISTEITCAILGAGVANNEMRSDKMLPWNNEPAKNISPFFIFADHVELVRERTRDIVAKAQAHGVIAETAELDSHTWPFGEAYDRASTFADKMLRPEY